MWTEVRLDARFLGNTLKGRGVKQSSPRVTRAMKDLFLLMVDEATDNILLNGPNVKTRTSRLKNHHEYDSDTSPRNNTGSPRWTEREAEQRKLEEKRRTAMERLGAGA
jgi:hypothetical protein